MKITDLLSSVTIELDTKAKNKTDVLNQAVELICKTKQITDKETFKKGVFNREKISTTGVGEGIAIPHCKSNVVKKPQLAAMVIKDGVDYDSLDGEKVQLLFLIAAPDSKDNVHLDVLARLSCLLMHDDFKSSLLAAKNKKEFIAAIDKAEQNHIAQEQAASGVVQASTKTKAKKAKVAKQPAVVKHEWPKIVCVTACPTGIAHTYMAQEALDKAAKEMGVNIKVETRGANPKNLLTQDEIDHAEAVIISADIAVPMERFDGKPLLCVGTSKAIKDAKSLIDRSLSGKIGTYRNIVNPGPRAKKTDNSFGMKERFGHKLYKQLLNGLSHMIPFVVAGGILMSISYIIDRCCGVNPAHLGPGQVFGQVNIIAQIFNIFGANVILGLMIPILAGFISYSIAGKQGLVAGFAAGIAATTIYIIGSNIYRPEGYKLAFNFLWFFDVAKNGLATLGNDGSLASMAVKYSPGFFGGLFGGFAAGYLTIATQKMFSKFSKNFQGVRDILLVPLISALFIMIAMLFINAGFTYVTYGINKGLGVFQGSKGLGPMIGLGIILAAVCAIDMGGPISKAAHLLTIDWISKALREGITSEFGVFASTALGASIAGSMVPPICLAFACWLFPQKFSEEDRKPAAANLITGVFGITEGAIPYCIKNPKTWIATITGSITAGICSVLMSGRAISPEGGTIAFAVATSVTWTAILSFVAVIIGSVVAAVILGFVYKDVDPAEAKLGLWKGIPIGFRSAEARKHALDLKLAKKDIKFNQLAFDDYIARINSIKENLDLKLGEKRGLFSKERCDKIAIIYEKKKKDLQFKIDEKRVELEQIAKKNKENFNEEKFALLKVAIAEKKAEIDKQEKERLAKLAAKQKMKEEKAARKQAAA